MGIRGVQRSPLVLLSHRHWAWLTIARPACPPLTGREANHPSLKRPSLQTGAAFSLVRGVLGHRAVLIVTHDASRWSVPSINRQWKMGQELRWTYRRSHCHAPLQARSAEITPWCPHRLARLVGHRDQARALHAVPHVRSFCRLPGSERGVRSQQRKSPATTQVLDHRLLSQLSSAHGTFRKC